MFTGIVEKTGTVESIARAEPEHPAARLTVTTALDLASTSIGASIAVDGVCLTIVDLDVARGRFAADLGPETLMLTTLGSMAPGARVHLERPLRLGTSSGATWSRDTSTRSGCWSPAARTARRSTSRSPSQATSGRRSPPRGRSRSTASA